MKSEQGGQIDRNIQRGRHFTFLARLTQSTGTRFRGIASEEYTAVCIDTVGIARVFGDQSAQDFAYFLQVNCSTPFQPEICTSATPLHWVRDSQAVKACKIKGTPNGANTFDLRDWHSNSGGTWQNWWSENGVFKTAPAAEFQGCTSVVLEADWESQVTIFPNPVTDYLQVNIPDGLGVSEIQIVDLQGKIVYFNRFEKGGTAWNNTSNLQISTHGFPKSVYCLRIRGARGVLVQKLVVQ